MPQKEICPNALLQVSVAIPTYTLTLRSKAFVLAYSSLLKDKLVAFNTAQLPHEVEAKVRNSRVLNELPKFSARC
jgi:hypothetical protein